MPNPAFTVHFHPDLWPLWEQAINAAFATAATARDVHQQQIYLDLIGRAARVSLKVEPHEWEPLRQALDILYTAEGNAEKKIEIIRLMKAIVEGDGF